MKTVAFTGHRPEKLSFRESEKDEKYLRFRKIQLKIIKRLAELGYTRFISGMARGFDMWAAEDVCALKKENEHIKLVCAVPYVGQQEAWRGEYKSRWEKVVSQSDEVVYTSNQYSKSCFHIRNRYMVDNSEVVVCCFDGTAGGTAYTVDYALKHDKIVIQINPDTCNVEIISERKL